MRPVRRLAKFFATTAFVCVAITGFGDPAGKVVDETDVRVQSVMAAQDEVTPSLMEQPEILGTAVGVSEAGDPMLIVYVNRDAANAAKAIGTLPGEVRGTPVKVELMDEIRAMGYTARQTPPISLGTSGGWTYDLANGYCCGGTLGGLVRIGTTLYILSAGHVLEDAQSFFRLERVMLARKNAESERKIPRE